MRPFEEILAIDSAAAFDCAALELFRFQAERCGVYREYLAEIGVDPAAVRRVDEIPMLPIEFFKWRDVYCGDTEPQIVFTSSNTGQSVASHHMMASTALYEAAFTAAFERFYGNPARWSLYGLLPNYLQREGSSLVYMVDRLIGRCGSGGFYLDDYERLLADMAADPKPKILLGVSYALWDLAERYAPKLRDTIVMETGGMKGRRETNTMPQWAGSCWYYLRYLDPDNDKQFVDPEKEKYWMPVDLYVGGAEHAVLHLLYARFWHKVLYDIGAVSTPEPFHKLINQGMILGISYKDSRGALVPMDKVVKGENGPVHKETGEKLTEFPAKMSKSLKNVVNPDDVIRDYGADAMRLYEMFMGPLQAVKPWSTQGVEGVFRFLKRSWRMIAQTEIADIPLTPAQEKLLHATIRKVTEDTETLNFNTAISQMMIFLNEFSKLEKMPREAAEIYAKLLCPYAPHIAEEMWEILGHEAPLSLAPWPEFDESKLKEDEIEIMVQVQGKPRVRMMMPTSADPDTMRELALANPQVQKAIEGKQLVKAICVPKRIVNLVVK